MKQKPPSRVWGNNYDCQFMSPTGIRCTQKAVWKVQYYGQHKGVPSVHAMLCVRHARMVDSRIPEKLQGAKRFQPVGS